MDFQDSILISTAALSLIIFTVKIINILILRYKFFIRPQKNLKSTYGSWALITGSTDGIGKSIAFQMFSQGINLILVGRNVEKLETTVNEIKHKQLDHQVEVKTIVIDFAKDDQSKVIRAIEEGVVVTIGSGSSSAVSSYPLFAIDSATKAYIAQFSRSIGVEYKQYGIDVQCQCFA